MKNFKVTVDILSIIEFIKQVKAGEREPEEVIGLVLPQEYERANALMKEYGEEIKAKR